MSNVMKQKFCNQCGSQVLEYADVCPHCGAKIMWRCFCGAINSPEQQFCEYCGRRRVEHVYIADPLPKTGISKKLIASALVVAIGVFGVFAASHYLRNREQDENNIALEVQKETPSKAEINDTSISSSKAVYDTLTLKNYDAEKYSEYALGSAYKKSEFYSVTFLNDLSNVGEDYWDVSMAQDGSVLAWTSRTGRYRDLYIGADGCVILPEDCTTLFHYWSNLEIIQFGNCVDTSNIKSMKYLFCRCDSLKTIDISEWDTAGVEDMSSLFTGCGNLVELDISGWDTSDVVDMSNMFQWCDSLLQLNLGNWDTSNVTDMSKMFAGCSSLSKLEIGTWDTSSVTDMTSMFMGCEKPLTIDVGAWDVSSVASTENMFESCYNLREIDVKNWNTSSVKNMSSMFGGCVSLKEIDVSNWDTSSVTDMDKMFWCCSALTYLDLSQWDTSAVINAHDIFSGCHNELEIISGSNHIFESPSD